MVEVDRARKFFKEYEDLCKKYNVSLAHEDYHGAFLLEPYDEDNIEWVKWAQLAGNEDAWHVDWDEDRKIVEELTNKRDEMKIKLEELIGNENWLLLDDIIFDTMECEEVRPATEEEMELRTEIRRTELKINKYL